jgi:Mg-chelatase subunit ChlD
VQPARCQRPPARPVYGHDRVGLVGFHDRGFVIARPAGVHDARLQQRVLDLGKRVDGVFTNITDGLRKGIELLEQTPPGILRRAWLLTDGYPNRESDTIDQVVEAARQAYINVNTIGFGDHYDEALLRRISSTTHNGKFVSVKSLRQLTDALGAGGRVPARERRHRAECTVLIIDLSGSMMTDHMEGRRKIEVVQDAIIQLLNYKMKCFS